MATRLKAPVGPDDELAAILENAGLHDDGAAARSSKPGSRSATAKTTLRMMRSSRISRRAP